MAKGVLQVRKYSSRQALLSTANASVYSCAFAQEFRAAGLADLCLEELANLQITSACLSARLLAVARKVITS